jgi:hypothetical protein
MEARLLSTDEVKTCVDKIPEGSDLAYIKLIGFSKGFLNIVKENGEELDKSIEQAKDYVLLCDRESLREELHSVVDRFCNSIEKVNNE